MKTIVMIPLMLLYFIPSLAQTTRYEYSGRFNPTVKQEKLREVIFINDLSTELWLKLAVPDKERFDLKQRKTVQGYYNYNTIVDYVLVAVSTVSKGKLLTAKSTSDKLTPAQKNVLNAVEVGGDIFIDIYFKYKIGPADGTANPIIKGQIALTAVPHREAEFPGGNKQFSAFMQEKILNQLTKPEAVEKVQRSVVHFTIDEEGRVVHVKLAKTTSDKALDKLVLDAMNQMPNWKPAVNAKGIKIKQQFSIPLGTDGC